MSQKKILDGENNVNEQELQNLGNNQNQFAPYVNMQYYQNYAQDNYKENNQQNFQDKSNEEENENKLENFKQYLTNISEQFQQESIGCQFLTVCNGIICLLIIGIILKSL